ncbi:MAG TPA: hypothetical protein EYN69_04525 [Flavobacteriales bacterium]|nr:hypothetical protein [Flavobacteriales bacterium]
MLDSLTYKKKNIILTVTAVIFLFLSYELAFEKTMAVNNSCSELEKQLELAVNAPGQIALLQSKLQSIERVIGSQTDSGIDPQQQLLEFVSNYCESEKITLVEFPKPLSHAADDYSIETNIFIVKGNFVKILKLVYELEQSQSVGKIVSVDYKSKKNLRTKRLELKATIFLQNIKKLS